MKVYNLKIAIRNAKKNGVLSFAKLFGITISFAVVLFAAAYVYYETSFDKHVPDHDKIFRCLMQGKINGRDADFAVTSPEMAAAITESVPEVEEATRLRTLGNTTVYFKDKSFDAKQLLVADPNVFSFFGIPVKTERKIIFEDPDDIAIAKSLAEANFGSVDKALNKTVKIRGEDCTITSIFNDIPSNFHLSTQIVKNIEDDNPDEVGWGSQNYYTYIKTKTANTDVDELNFKISKTVYTHWNDVVDGANAQSWEDLKPFPETYIFYNAEPLRKIHFSSHRFDPAITANKTYVYGAIIISILVLLISSINYINLTIANFSTRLKEIGIRKTTGAKNNQISKQFIAESLLFWICGFILAIVMYEVFAAHLSKFLGFEIKITNNELFKLVSASFFVLIIFNLITIITPIFYASGKRVLSLIKEERGSNKSISVKNSFVFLQYVLSALIILGTITVQKQVNYMVNKDRGYDKENIMAFNAWGMSPETRQTFINELKSFAPIKSVSTSEQYFGGDPSMTDAYFETREDENFFHTSVLSVDDEFVNTFNLKIKEGRFFDKQKKTDFEAVLLNESAAKEYGDEEKLIGKNILTGSQKYKVIGIVSDFNFRSLHHEIQPLIIRRIENLGNVFVKINNNQIPETIKFVEDQWKKFNISYPLDYTFHDEIIASHYTKDQQAKKLLLFLSIVSILIACVGLYAISLFTIFRKTKEIGVRKVNGAKLGEIISMLNLDFLKWVLIAYVIASPIAYFAMTKWLENFAFKTKISWWIFVLAGTIALLVSLITVSWQSFRAASKNPVEALRYE